MPNCRSFLFLFRKATRIELIKLFCLLFLFFFRNESIQANQLFKTTTNQISTVVTQTLQFKKWMPNANEDLQTIRIIQITLNRLPNWDFSLLKCVFWAYTYQCETLLNTHRFQRHDVTVKKKPYRQEHNPLRHLLTPHARAHFVHSTLKFKFPLQTQSVPYSVHFSQQLVTFFTHTQKSLLFKVSRSSNIKLWMSKNVSDPKTVCT